MTEWSHALYAVSKWYLLIWKSIFRNLTMVNFFWDLDLFVPLTYLNHFSRKIERLANLLKTFLLDNQISFHHLLVQSLNILSGTWFLFESKRFYCHGLFTSTRKTDWLTAVVNGTRQISGDGDTLVPLPQPFAGRSDQRRSKAKGLGLVKNSRIEINAHFHSDIPFGYFGLRFKKSRFPEKISVRRDKINLSRFTDLYIFLPKFPGFFE